MVELVREGSFGLVRRPVSLAGSWPGVCESPNEEAIRATGPVNVDLFYLTLNSGDFIERLAEEVIRAGILLTGWNETECLNFRSALWQSAHRFVVNHVSAVDRGPEFEELARLLKVKL